MTRKERYDYVLKYFREQMPEVQTELEFSSVFQLLVAVILSAQCTDKRINQVTPELFRHFPDAKTMATAEVEDVLEYVKSVSYPNSKAEHLVKMARMLVERHEEGTAGYEPAARLAGGWQEDSECDTERCFRQVFHGCGYTRLPCQSPVRTRHKER